MVNSLFTSSVIMDLMSCAAKKANSRRNYFMVLKLFSSNHLLRWYTDAQTNQSAFGILTGRQCVVMTGPLAKRFCVLVRVMQFLGFFPYSWPTSPSNDRPCLSLALCLWAVFLHLIYLGIFSFKETLYPKVFSNIGNLSLMLANAFSRVLPVILESLMVIKCRQLAHLLPLLEEAVSDVATLDMSSNVISKINKFSLGLIIFALSGSVINALIIASRTYIYLLPFLTITSFAESSMYLFQISFFFWALVFMGNYVNHLVRAVLPTPVTVELQPWRAMTHVQYDDSWHLQMTHFLHLEHRIRKVNTVIVEFH